MTRSNKAISKPLSARAVETMKPGDKVKVDTDENEGLRVRCGSTGIKTFFYRYKSPDTGKLVQLKIGNFPDISLSDARLELQKLKAIRRSGVCPKRHMEEEKAAKERLKREAELAEKVQNFTVRELVELYLTRFIEDRLVEDQRNPGQKKRIPGARKPKGQSETRRTLEGDAVRVLGDVPAREVTRKMIVNMIMDIVGRGANVQAGNVLRELSAAYEFAIGLDMFEEEFANPAVLAKASLRQAKVRLTSQKGKRVLSDKELSTVLQWLPGSGFSATQKKILWLTLFTGARTGEVCVAEWQDIDFKNATWHIRDTKNEAERYVQLPKQAIELLKQQEKVTNTFVFPSTRTGVPIQQKSLSETKWALKNPDKVQNGQRFKTEQLWIDSIPDWSPHDLRRTVRTGLARLGCRTEVAEAILGHSKRGIEGTYDLHRYEAECREWLQKWADHLDELT